jgi:hypothetical protein
MKHEISLYFVISPYFYIPTRYQNVHNCCYALIFYMNCFVKSSLLKHKIDALYQMPFSKLLVGNLVAIVDSQVDNY